MGVLGARLESENQVSRIGHAGFPILGNVSSRAVKSDFPEDAMRRECSGQLTNSEKQQACLKHSEFTLDFTEIYREISPAF